MFQFKAGSPADIMAKQMDFLFNEGRKIAAQVDKQQVQDEEVDREIEQAQLEDHDCGLDEGGEGSCDNDIHLAE